MSDDKQKTRTKLLNELESIKTLLKDDRLNELEPPILTSTIDDIDAAPLLTDIHEGDVAVADDVIPILEEAVELPVALDIKLDEVAQVPHAAEAEQQQSLFNPATASTSPPALPAMEEASIKPVPATLSSGRGENPFLPRHIRERIAANRKQQSAMMESLLSPAASAPAQQAGATQTSAPAPDSPSSSAKRASSVPSDQQLIDEMVERFLPAIETALRERLQALLHEQRDTQEDNDS